MSRARDDCAVCQGKPPDQTPKLTLDELTPEQVEAWAERAERIGVDGVRHAMDPAKIEGVYRLDHDVHCSYAEGAPGREHGHRHRKGFAGWSRCGLPLILGWNCAENNISNFEDFWAEVQVIEKVQDEQRLRDSDELSRRLLGLEELAARFDSRQATLANLKRFVQPIYTAMRNANATKDLTVRFEVEVPVPGTDETRKEWTSAKLTGMRQFDEVGRERMSDKVSEMLKRAENLADGANTRVDYGNVDELSSERRALKRFEQRLRDWLDDSDAFFTERNLTLAVIRTYRSLDNLPDHVKLVGGTIVVEGSERVVIGLGE